MDKLLLFGLAAVIVNLIGYVPYIRGVLTGDVKPQRVTWGIWTILTTIAFVNQIVNGGGYSVLFFGSTVALVGIVFVLSLFKGIGGASKFDRSVLVASALLFIVWIVLRESYYSTLFAVTIDAIGALPTLIKAYRQPETEMYLQWILAAFGGLLGMVALPKFAFILVVYPLYVVIMNSAIVLTKYLGELTQLRAKVITE